MVKKLAFLCLILIILLTIINISQAASTENNNEGGWNYLKWGMTIKEATNLLNRNDQIQIYPSSSSEEIYLDMVGLVYQGNLRKGNSTYNQLSIPEIYSGVIRGALDCYYSVDRGIDLLFLGMKMNLNAIRLTFLKKDYDKHEQDIFWKLKSKYPSGEMSMLKDSEGKKYPNGFNYYNRNLFVGTHWEYNTLYISYANPLPFQERIEEVLAKKRKGEDKVKTNINKTVF